MIAGSKTVVRKHRQKQLARFKLAVHRAHRALDAVVECAETGRYYKGRTTLAVLQGFIRQIERFNESYVRQEYLRHVAMGAGRDAEIAKRELADIEAEKAAPPPKVQES